MNVGIFYKCNKCGCKTNAGIKVGDYVLCSNCLAHKEPIIPNKNENQKAIECLKDVWRKIKNAEFNHCGTIDCDIAEIGEIIDQKISELKGE